MVAEPPSDATMCRAADSEPLPNAEHPLAAAMATIAAPAKQIWVVKHRPVRPVPLKYRSLTKMDRIGV